MPRNAKQFGRYAAVFVRMTCILRIRWCFRLPDLIHVDNGVEFHSRAFERGCQQHGIRIEYRPPATPRFGGHIERLMGTLMGRIHALPGTTFSSVAARGDYASEARAVLSFRDDAVSVVMRSSTPQPERTAA